MKFTRAEQARGGIRLAGENMLQWNKREPRLNGRRRQGPAGSAAPAHQKIGSIFN